MVPTLDLVRGITAVVDVPVIASGGLMDGSDISASIAAGASAAALGTAFLVSTESGAPKVHKDAILNARRDSTVITRAFSGRPARGLPEQIHSNTRRPGTFHSALSIAERVHAYHAHSSGAAREPGFPIAL